MGMKRKGVCYDTGRVLMEGNWRPKFDLGIVRREIEIIGSDLHCNAIRVQGLDIERLAAASEHALSQGLEVWFSPEMWDKGQEETIEYLRRAAGAAEDLRRRWSGKVVFSLGSELTLFAQGIVAGKNVFDRMNRPSFWENIRAGKHNGPLNSFLAKEYAVVRQVFHGPLTYFSVPFESVDWSIFDFVGVDLYRDARIKAEYGSMAKKWLDYNKPVVIGEFGCCTYRGAELLGGNGFMIAFGMMEDYLGPDLHLPEMITRMASIPPRVDGHYVRDERVQASELTEQLEVLDAAGVDGAFVFTFVSPNSPHNEDPRYDSDMASFSLVKSYAEKETVEEFARQAAMQGRELFGAELGPDIPTRIWGETGRHGTTYPDLPWEPKESFRAVADYYSKH